MSARDVSLIYYIRMREQIMIELKNQISCHVQKSIVLFASFTRKKYLQQKPITMLILPGPQPPMHSVRNTLAQMILEENNLISYSYPWQTSMHKLFKN